MSNTPKVAVALIGGGAIAPLHAKYLLLSPTCELVAIIDPFIPGRELAQSLSVPHFSTVPELLSSLEKAPDTYIICVPSSLHIGVAVDLLNVATPKAILVEKPLSTDSSSGAQFLDMAHKKQCKVVVGHHRRFHPSLDASKQIIQSGKLGRITAISGQWTAKKSDDYFAQSKWRCSRKQGGGPVWTNFVHDIDVLHYLTGSRIVRVWVTGTVNRRTHEGVPKSDAVEEGAAMLLQFSNGTVGTFIICDNVSSPYGWEAATGENPSFPKAGSGLDCYRIFGTEGTLSAPDGALWTYRKDGAEEAERRGLEVGWNIPMAKEVLTVNDGIPFQRQAEHLARVVRGSEEPRCSGEDGLAAVKVCEAIIQALRSGDGFPVNIC
jgi:predicted dehydrogenase